MIDSRPSTTTNNLLHKVRDAMLTHWPEVNKPPTSVPIEPYTLRDIVNKLMLLDSVEDNGFLGNLTEDQNSRLDALLLKYENKALKEHVESLVFQLGQVNRQNAKLHTEKAELRERIAVLMKNK